MTTCTIVLRASLQTHSAVTLDTLRRSLKCDPGASLSDRYRRSFSTDQGFEFDYVGVIWGRDIAYDFDKNSWFGNKQSSYDRFSDEQGYDEGSVEWVELPPEFRPQQGLFVAQVVGESMNRRIPNGSWCLFRQIRGGTRQGKVVVAQHREISDVEMGGHFTVKVYESTKAELSNGTWKHTRITLNPDTTASGYAPIVLEEREAEDLRIIAELVAVLG